MKLLKGAVIILKSILIVEDDKEQREFLNNTALKMKPELELYSTGSFNKALDIAKSKLIEAFFLDIQLEDGNGIDLAKRIREISRYRFTPIVFLTVIHTKEMEAFHDIHSYDYVIKPYSDEELKKVMEPILTEYRLVQKLEEKWLDLNFNGAVLKLKLSAIKYVEYRFRRIIITREKEEIKYKIMPLGKFMKFLSDDFIQVHQSFVINRQFVEKIDFKNREISILGIESKIPIGTTYRKLIEEVLYDYIADDDSIG